MQFPQPILTLIAGVIAGLAAAVPATLHAQHPLCDGNRFFEPVFASVNETSGIRYAQDTRYNGDSVDLELDVYQPVGDTASNRPLVILAHGGGFFTGNKDQTEITFLAEALARRGYVTASIQYRLDNALNLTNNDAIIAAIYRAQQDGRAAVRFFRQSYAQGNPYGIDTSEIFIGGSSAGSILALHAAFADSTELTNFPGINNAGLLNNVGGVEGEGGSLGFSSGVEGVINLCGAIGRQTWIQDTTQGIISLHSNNDPIVPYGSGSLSDPAGGSIFSLPVDGSAALDSHATANNIPSQFYTWPDAGHAPYSNLGQPYRDTTTRFVVRHLYTLVCGQEPFYLQRQQADVSCPGNQDGVATISPQNGTAPYSVAWDNSMSTDTQRTGLSTGTYYVTVTDANGLDRRDSITIGAPPALSLNGFVGDASAPGAADGNINLIVIGGNAGYSYDWSNGDTVQDPQGLAPGTYSVTVTDERGCTAQDTFEVTAPSARGKPGQRRALRIAPNPAANQVAVRLPETLQTAAARLVNVQGQTAWQGRLHGGSNQLSLRHLPAGSYALRIQAKDWRSTGRLLIR